ncbi:Enzymatic polyprotein, partial [Mucuna pruriens]
MIALIDSGADINCIQEGLIPTKYYEKTLEGVTSANGSRMHIQYKLPKAKICKNQICFNTAFVLVTEKGLVTEKVGKEICFEFIERMIETDASDIGYGGILNQKLPNSLKEQVIKYHLGIWHLSQQKYSIVKKQRFSIVLCVQKFQDDVFNKKVLIRTDCKVALNVLTKDVQNLVSKHILARWQALLSCFDFEIEHIKGKDNFLPDFLTR